MHNFNSPGAAGAYETVVQTPHCPEVYTHVATCTSLHAMMENLM